MYTADVPGRLIYILFVALQAVSVNSESSSSYGERPGAVGELVKPRPQTHWHRWRTCRRQTSHRTPACLPARFPTQGSAPPSQHLFGAWIRVRPQGGQPFAAVSPAGCPTHRSPETLPIPARNTRTIVVQHSPPKQRPPMDAFTGPRHSFLGARYQRMPESAQDTYC